MAQHLCVHFSFPFLCPATRWLQWLWLSSLKLTGQTSSCREPRQSLELLSHPFPKRSKAFLSNKNPYPAFFQGSQKLVWQCICNPLRHDRRWEETVPTCRSMAESPVEGGMPWGPGGGMTGLQLPAQPSSPRSRSAEQGPRHTPRLCLSASRKQIQSLPNDTEWY